MKIAIKKEELFIKGIVFKVTLYKMHTLILVQVHCIQCPYNKEVNIFKLTIRSVTRLINNQNELCITGSCFIITMSKISRMSCPQ